MTVPLTFEIGDNMSSFLFNQYFLSSRLTEWKPIYDETTITLVVSHY